jgi:hypothetical protein
MALRGLLYCLMMAINFDVRRSGCQRWFVKLFSYCLMPICFNIPLREWLSKTVWSGFDKDIALIGERSVASEALLPNKAGRKM